MQPNGIHLDAGALLAAILEGILYGFSLLMFFGITWELTRRSNSYARNKPMIIVACLLLVINTAHIILGIVRLEEGLVSHQKAKGGPLAYFEDTESQISIVRDSLYLIQNLLGIGVVIRSCYVVWQSLLIIAFPVVTWCGVLAAGSGYARASITSTSSGSTGFFSTRTGSWMTAYYVCTLVSSFSSTALLAYRLWAIDHHIATRKTFLLALLRIITDTGLLYSITLLVVFLCFITQNRGQYVLLDMVMPIISITSYMIMVRTAMTKPMPQGDEVRTKNRIIRTFNPNRTILSNNPQENSIKALQVNVTQDQYTEIDKDHRLEPSVDSTSSNGPHDV
ncbi:hypothetical protein SERLA73DRAFT_188288 [Serpula lacrymans var. lacrymans S7.3]|uniref:Uncharacterized protein n=2 Tax=Serpula lacrymans var. lacrymans TaxID=341189 RepID=F8QB25_SERL3|nr:uncharacterized protein SERLADRAFT_478352 [Serpula lacrymans var. lacrymans S7.9]EGN94411.1 hypothetical protein SERLA73DRAFT_188288 [Serpula lacrymans var. lacrymans S7.3]EGO19892.1 hypothetical protein SERLADRAFT_478352 [Serpula lacrymans var. lacrymans S7.9]